MNKLRNRSGAEMPRSFIFFIFLIASIVIDEAIKIFVRNNMYLGESIHVIKGFFRFTYLENRGIAFSFMEDNKLFLIFMPSLLIIILSVIYFLKRKEMGISYDIGSGLCIGGGLANLFDRVVYSSVTDYVDIGSFAIFNLADVFINIGIFLLCLNFLFFRKDEDIE